MLRRRSSPAIPKLTLLPIRGFGASPKTAPDLSHAIYDGVLVCSGDAAVVVLKDRLAGLARSYMLWPENETLHGHGATMRFLPGDTTEVWDKFKFSGVEPIRIWLRKI
jgi:hypothetical protein